MSVTVTYFKGTDAAIRIAVDDSLIRAQGVTDFTLVGSTITTEFESENGDFVKFDNSKVTIVDALTYDIAPTAADVVAFQLGVHDISGLVQVSSGAKFGFKIKKDFEVDRLIQT